MHMHKTKLTGVIVLGVMASHICQAQQASISQTSHSASMSVSLTIASPSPPLTWEQRQEKLKQRYELQQQERLAQQQCFSDLQSQQASHSTGKHCVPSK